MQTSVSRYARFRLPIGPERTLDLPDDTLRRLGVAPGDELTLLVYDGHAVFHKAPPTESADPSEAAPVFAIEGMLADYFTDHEDVMRFIEEERGPWPEE